MMLHRRCTGSRHADIDVKNGNVFSKSKPAASESLAGLMARNGNKPIEAMGSAEKSESAANR